MFKFIYLRLCKLKFVSSLKREGLGEFGVVLLHVTSKILVPRLYSATPRSEEYKLVLILTRDRTVN